MGKGRRRESKEYKRRRRRKSRDRRRDPEHKNIFDPLTTKSFLVL